MRVLDWFIFGYLFGYVVFFTCFTFGVTWMDDVYYLWNNLFYGSIGAWLTLYVTGKQEVKHKVKYPLVFSCIMYVWELIVFFTGWDVNNHWAVIACFSVLVLIIAYFMVREYSRINKWLSK